MNKTFICSCGEEYHGLRPLTCEAQRKQKMINKGISREFQNSTAADLISIGLACAGPVGWIALLALNSACEE